MIRFKLFERLCVLLTVALVLATPLRAQDLPPPVGAVALRVTGAVPVTNSGDEAHFDLAMLQSLPDATFATSTIWTDGVRTFRGLWLGTLTARLGITSGTLEASALNEYLIDIPLSDAVDGGALIAYELDGKPMSVREKGPLWIVFPYDANPRYQSEVYYARSIWQFDTLVVLP